MSDSLVELAFRVIEQQGIIAGLLILQMWKNRGERRELLQKVCELNRFIMRCLERELEVEHGRNGDSVPVPETQGGSFSGPTVGLLPRRASALKWPHTRS